MLAHFTAVLSSSVVLSKHKHIYLERAQLELRVGNTAAIDSNPKILSNNKISLCSATPFSYDPIAATEYPAMKYLENTWAKGAA